jgi:hypothetical protein
VTASTNQAVLDVACECYRRADVAHPGSDDAEIAEHAVSLALGRGDASNPQWLLDDVLRDARRSVLRGRQRHLRAVRAAGDLAMRNQPTGASRGLVDTNSPEAIALAGELNDILAAKAATLGPVAQRVLAGLLIGETVEQTAASARVSPATVKRVQRQLRAVARAAGYRAAA